MYLTRFNRKDGHPHEDYFYNNGEGALAHLSLFAGDNSGLYSSVVASNEGTNTVLRMLVFSDDGSVTDYRLSGFARLKPEFCTPAERHLIFAITNINDRTMRCNIVCLNSGMSIPPAETVGLNMITPIIVEDIQISRVSDTIWEDQYGMKYEASKDDESRMVSQSTGEVYCVSKRSADGTPEAIITLWEHQNQARWCK